ncbi:MAG: TIGR03118 family protein [Candidatus Acidiferrales bacterium]
MRNSARAMKAFLAGSVLAILPVSTFAQHYTQENLVSDIAQPDNADGTKVGTDTNLKNPWGLARGASSPWWVNNEGTGTSTLYSGGGATVPLVVTVPNAAGTKGPSSPTGIIFNGTGDFALAANNPAAFIFATKNGTISGWGPPATPNSAGVGQSTAINEVDESKNGAVFLGLTWVEMDGNHFLLAANFSQNRIEVFDKNFKHVKISEEAFDDNRIPVDFAPYNVQAVGATVVVAYAKQNATKTAADDTCGEQCGFVDVFTAKGKLVLRLEDGPWFQAPWGVALAPQDFGFFSHDLLIGNRFGGTIAAFDVVTGHFLGNLLDATSAPIAISGLWGLEFDNRGGNEAGGTANPSTGPALFFSAGINGYADGLFGTLTPVAAELNAEDHE